MRLNDRLYYFAILISLLLIIIFLFLFFSSNSKEMKLEYQKIQSVLTVEIEGKNKEVDLLKSEIKVLNERINELEQRVVSNERTQNQYNYTITQNETSIKKLREIIENLPQLSKKLAIINQESIDDSSIDVSLDYVEWFSSEEAEKAANEDNDENAASLNNGFYIRNKQIEDHKARIMSDTLIYVLEGAELKLADNNKFINNTDSLKDRLFHVYSIDDKIIILEEQYRP